MAKAMTAQEFVAYWTERGEESCSLLEANEESIYENEAQFRSECALFGDAGPGQGYQLNRMKAEIRAVKDRLFKLTGKSW